MPIKADDVPTLHHYAEGVMERVAHHAGNVGAVALALLGAIVWRAEEGTISIRPYGKGLGNVLHVTINKRNFSFRYAHENEEIEMRENGIGGPIVQTFTNSTALPSVEQFFRSL